MFETKPVKIQTLGEKLVAARNHLGVSVGEICKISKLPPKYLEALEQGDYARLPANVYIKGFLKTLAQIYRVPVADLLLLFETEKRLEDKISANPVKIRESFSRFVLSPRLVAFALVVAAGIASLSYLYVQISSVKKPPRLEVFSPQASQELESHLVMVQGKTEPGASVFLNNQPIVVDVSGEFRENLSLAPGTNQLVIKAVNKFDKETVVTRSVAVVEKLIAGVQHQGANGGSGLFGTAGEDKPSVELQIQVGPAAAWISIEADGESRFTGMMLAGSSQTARGREITISTGNAGSTRVLLGGQDLGVMGKDGEVLRDVEFSK